MRLLFITSNRLGDAVLSTGLLDAMLTRFQLDEVVVACGPIPAPLFAGVPHLKTIIPLKKEKYHRHWLKLWLQTVPYKWDVVVDLRNSMVSYALLSKDVFRFTHADKTKHKSVQLAAVGELPSIPLNKIWLTDDARTYAKHVMPDGAPILALCPTANWQPKTWAAEHFIATTRALPFSRIAVFGAGNERAQATPVIEALKTTHEVIDLVGKTDPLQAAACLERAQLCVGNDSGLMHIAAAMGTRTLGIFGPSSDVEYAPHGLRTAFVRGAPFYGLDKTENPTALIQAVRVDAVVSAAKKLLG